MESFLTIRSKAIRLLFLALHSQGRKDPGHF